MWPHGCIGFPSLADAGRPLQRSSGRGGILHHVHPMEVSSRQKCQAAARWLPLAGFDFEQIRSERSVLPERRDLIGVFPGELRLVASEMPVRRSLAVDRTQQVERVDDALRPQIEM